MGSTGINPKRAGGGVSGLLERMDPAGPLHEHQKGMFDQQRKDQRSALGVISWIENTSIDVSEHLRNAAACLCVQGWQGKMFRRCPRLDHPGFRTETCRPPIVGDAVVETADVT